MSTASYRDFEYLKDKRMNDFEESFDEEESDEDNPCNHCNGKKKGRCAECEV